MDAASNSATAVVGEDTDLLVLLCLHADVKSQPLFFKSEKKQTAKKNHKVWHINRVKSVMGPVLCLLLPFVHAVSGSDTTSRLYGVGKGAALRKLRSDSAFKEVAYVFIRQSSLEEIVGAGEKALCCLYGGRPNESLDVLLYRRFCEKVATSNTTVKVQNLPPLLLQPRDTTVPESILFNLIISLLIIYFIYFKSRRLGMVKNSRPASCAHY